MPDFWADSQHRPNFTGLVGISDDERRKMINDLFRTMSTMNMSSLNAANDQASYLNLTPGARAQRTGQINYMGNLAAERGTNDINQYVTGHNKAMMQWLLSMAQNQEQFKQQQDLQKRGQLMSLLSNLGQAAGYAVGQKFGK